MGGIGEDEESVIVSDVMAIMRVFYEIMQAESKQRVKIVERTQVKAGERAEKLRTQMSDVAAQWSEDSTLVSWWSFVRNHSKESADPKNPCDIRPLASSWQDCSSVSRLTVPGLTSRGDKRGIEVLGTIQEEVLDTDADAFRSPTPAT